MPHSGKEKEEKEAVITNVRIEPAGEIQIVSTEKPVPPPPNKQIHPRRPLPPVPDKAGDEKPQD